MKEAQRDIDSREFAEWIAYEDIAPGNPERADLNAAFICVAISNAMRGKKGRSAKPADYMPKFRARRRVLPSVHELKRKLGIGLNMAKKGLEAKEKKNG